jgi:hypothetical protein
MSIRLEQVQQQLAALGMQRGVSLRAQPMPTRRRGWAWALLHVVLASTGNGGLPARRRHAQEQERHLQPPHDGQRPQRGAQPE